MITFYAKGNGKFRFHFTYEAIDTLVQWEHWGYAGINLELTSEWKKFVIVPDSLNGIDGSSGDQHTWETAKAAVRRLCLVDQGFGTDDVDLYLDDIKLFGDFKNSGLLD